MPPLKATEGRLAASAATAARPDISLREIARTAGISGGTARDVRLRLLAGQDPLPAGRSGERFGQPNRARTARLPGRSAAGQDLSTLLEALRRDPRLRYSDPGRGLLRWLDARMIVVDQIPVALEGIPAHRVDNVAAITRECTRAWNVFAEEMTQH